MHLARVTGAVVDIEQRREQQKKRERFVALFEQRRHGAHAQAQRRKLDEQLHLEDDILLRRRKGVGCRTAGDFVQRIAQADAGLHQRGHLLLDAGEGVGVVMSQQHVRQLVREL